jgi:cytoskeletal protein CcmA (bactofilin family)
MAEEITKQTVVEEGTEVEGTIRSKCPVKVSGTVHGEVATPSLVITQSGSVKGQVKVTELKSEGEIAGAIEADNVQLSGRVSDQTAIKAKTIEVKLAQQDGKLQVTFGNVELNVGERTVKVETTHAANGDRKGQPQAQAPAQPPQPRPEKR